MVLLLVVDYFSAFSTATDGVRKGAVLFFLLTVIGSVAVAIAVAIVAVAAVAGAVTVAATVAATVAVSCL